jgi:hypothetical protein
LELQSPPNSFPVPSQQITIFLGIDGHITSNS